MAERATAAVMRRALAQRQERRHRAVEDEPVAERFRRQQELEQKAQADRIAGEDAQGEASGQSVEANARRRARNAGGVKNGSETMTGQFHAGLGQCFGTG